MARSRKIWEEVTIAGLADRGKAVGKAQDGQVVFVDGVVPGDIVDVLLLRKKKGTWQGIPDRFHQYSADRVDAVCQHFDDCGGCKWQHLSYDAQLRHKQTLVSDAMQRIAKLKQVNLAPIIGADPIYRYRNKMEYSFSNQRWKTRAEIDYDQVLNQQGALGLHPPGFFNKVVDIQECWLQDQRADQIRNFIRHHALENKLPFFDPINHQGFLRNVIIRNTTLGHWMVVLSVAQPLIVQIEQLMEELKARFPWITSLNYVINQKKNDTLYDQKIENHHGLDHILEKIGHLTFKIRPKSFFQTNSVQAERLYCLARDFAALTGEETVLDLYTGTGTIALFLAAQCREVIGIEEVEDAIKDAVENAECNGIKNATFYTDDVKHLLNSPVLDQHRRPDIVITDPPRVGMHEQVLSKLLQLRPAKIIYISCNPATQARDLSFLKQEYLVERMQPVDMFPHTNHIENVALLIKKES